MQIRAARGFLAWDRRDLAKNSVVTLYTIERLETGAEVAVAMAIVASQKYRPERTRCRWPAAGWQLGWHLPA